MSIQQKKDVSELPLHSLLCATAYCIKENDFISAAKVMASAFFDDPAIRYLLGGEKEGISDWKYFYYILKSIHGKCIMLSTDKRANNLLILFPPQLKAIPTLRFLFGGGIGLCRSFGLKLFFRSLNYEKNCKTIKNKFVTPQTWYCMCFVVSPTMQKQGLGSQLIKPVLEIFNERHIPLYLETHKAANVSIYTHLGFTTVDVSSIPTTDITQYSMLKKQYPFPQDRQACQNR